MHNYLFDVKLFAAIRVDAASEKDAREKLALALDCASVTVEIGGATTTFEVSADGDADLVEIDGESP